VPTQKKVVLRKVRERISARMKKDHESFPKTAWRFPSNEWLISLKRHDGTKEYHSVTGSLQDARQVRDELLSGNRYRLAWIIDKERLPKKNTPRKPEG